MRLPSRPGKRVLIGIIVGGIAGLLLALGAEQMDHYTSTDAFCTSCHAMQSYIADTEAYKSSAHQTTASGVRPGCADCHIPKGLVTATYTHVVNGISDMWGEISLDYDDPDVWNAEKARLAYATRDWFRKNDSITCRECHEESSIKPTRQRGQKQHKEARETNMTCIDCHYNLVHEEIEPSERFLEQVEMGQ
jgi:nitrate/TMAO reductase-like tetraheme cytochrome c subunit